jgi:SAM-dependent methyltransferase
VRPVLGTLYRWVDPTLNYGRPVVADLVRASGGARHILDIAAGSGGDLRAARAIFPAARLTAFDFLPASLEALRADGIEAHALNLERDPFPLPAGSVDVVIANQILEHTKDLFWILHQVCTVLTPGGHLVVGVPNLASLHNRLLLAAGSQPTPIRSASAHVRGFTRGDMIDLLESCFPGGLELRRYRGSNFYPFPPVLAKPLARLFPSLAWGNFFLFRKAKAYQDQFLRFPADQQLETNFFVG